MGAIRRAFTWQEPSSAISIRDWFREYTLNDKVLAIFRGMSNYQCVNFSDMPAAEFIRQLKFAGTAGADPRGFLAFMEELVKVIKAKGGDVRTGCRVKRISVTDEVANGVVVNLPGEGETEIPAKVVISDVGPHGTVDLAGSQNFEKGYLKEVKERVRPLAYMCLEIASEKPLVDFRGVMVVPEGRRQMTMMCTSLVYPEYAPPGKHLLQAWAAPESSFLPLDTKKELDLMVQDIRETIPVSIATRRSCTSATAEGVADVPGDAGRAGPEDLGGEPVQRRGRGGAARAAGLPGCAASARIVVDDIKQRFKPAA